MNKMIRVLALSFAVLLFSCKNGNETPENNVGENVNQPDTVKTGLLNVEGEIFSVPSPIQTALLIQKLGLKYTKDILLPSNTVGKFNTDYSKALAMGIFGADLGYVSIYNQTQDALSYLASLKQIGDNLGITNAFDPKMLERFEKNITNKDSLLVLVGDAYRNSDAFLKNNKRPEIGHLVLVGGWVESVYLSASSYKSKPSDELKRRIAEQKYALERIIRILEKNNNIEETKGLLADLNDLKKVYENVKFEYKFIEPKTDTVKKITYINSESIVSISDDTLGQIIAKISEIRNKICHIS
ncbi:MAG: hypothetical protein N3F09_00840 [Bacteroidia bacterium]|nr:hypothetical protein [Bacteroidia bacterium]